MAREEYSIRDLCATVGLSRTTLLYYEEQGVVRPRRDAATGYRFYTPGDVFRVMNAILLKNVGVPVGELAQRLDEMPFASERFGDYRAMALRRSEYYGAQADRLAELGRLPDQVGSWWVRYVEPFYICYDGAEKGYHNFSQEEGLAPLLAHMPIGSLGGCCEGDELQNPMSFRCGRTVAVRHAHLIPGLPSGLPMLGGCQCLCTAGFSDNFGRHGGTFTWDLEQIRSCLDERGLKQAGQCFTPYTLPTEEGLYALMCLPVQ